MPYTVRYWFMPFMDFPSHVQWLIKHRGRALADALARENIETDAETAPGILMDADPSVKKLAVQWLVDTYIQGGFRWEDVQSGKESKAAHTLRLFGFNRRLLEGDARNLGSYTSLGQVYAAMRQFDISASEMKAEITPGIRALRRAEREAAMAESCVVYRDDMMIVAVPLSERASKWWGKGTQWCTAADKNNVFMNYHSMAPLVIIVFPKGMDGCSEVRKLQLFADERSFQFMNENDQQVSSEFIERNWNYLSRIMEWALRRNNNVLRYIPEKYRSRDMCFEAVKKNGWALEFVPGEYRNEALCLEAVKNDGAALMFVHEKYRNENLCFEAVGQNGLALQHVPEKYHHILSIKAVKQHGTALRFVKIKNRNKELYFEAIKQNGWALEDVPNYYVNETWCLEAVIKDGDALLLVPEQYRSEDLCLEAVKGSGYALIYVPDKHRKKALCFEAVKQTGMALRFVPEKHRDFDLCHTAIKQNGKALEYITPRNRSKSLCYEAVKQNGWALRFVPEHYRSEDLCLIAVKQYNHALEHVPEKYRSNAVFQEIINQSHVSPDMKWEPDITLKELAEVLSENGVTQNMVLEP